MDRRVAELNKTEATYHTCTQGRDSLIVVTYYITQCSLGTFLFRDINSFFFKHMLVTCVDPQAHSIVFQTDTLKIYISITSRFLVYTSQVFQNLPNVNYT